MIKQDFPRQLFWILFFTCVYLPLLVYLVEPFGRGKASITGTSFREPLNAWMLEKRHCDVSNEHSCAYHNHTCIYLDQEMTVHDVDGNPKEVLSKGAHCIPVQNKCNPQTSNSLLVDLGGGKYDYICECLYDGLVTKMDGGDCDVVKACGIGGSLLPATRPIDFDPLKEGKCQCPEGSVPTYDSQTGPGCTPKTWRNQHNQVSSCPLGYSKSPRGYRPEFIVASNFGDTCLPMPCKWNMIEPHEFHDENRFEDGYGCVCDYDNGWVGVMATDAETGMGMSAFGPSNASTNDSTTAPTTASLHFNGCVNVRVQERKHVTKTDFYKRNSPQVTIHEYELKEDSLVAALIGSTSVKITEPWSFTRHDYFQRKLEYATENKQLHCIRYEAYFEDSPSAPWKFPNRYLLFALPCAETKPEECSMICRSASKGKYKGLIILNPNLSGVTRLDTTFDKRTQTVTLDKFEESNFERFNVPDS